MSGPPRSRPGSWPISRRRACVVGLRDLGVAAEDVDGLVEAVEGTLANDPGPTEPGDLRALYLASL